MVKKYGANGDELLVPQKRNRHVPKNGDRFTLKMNDGKHIVGLVVNDDARIVLDESKKIVVYLYSRFVDEINDIESFSFDKFDLLVAPFFTLKQMWSLGYAVTVKNEPLTPNETFETNYFESQIPGKYFDDLGNEVAAPDPSLKVPIGIAAFGNLTTLDLDIRESLGIPIPEWGESYFK